MTLIVTTMSQYEQAVFASKTDWRVRAISAANLHQRTHHLYMAQAEAAGAGAGAGDAGLTFVLPKNVLRKFITCADLRTQVGAFMYGASPPDNALVKEVRVLVLAPQVGTHQSVAFPKQAPEHEALRGLEPLGWIHTQPNELPHLSPQDVTLHARLQAELGAHGFDAASGRAIVLTVAFTPGSASLAAYRVTPAGLEWGAANRDLTSAHPPGYVPALHCAKVQMLLSDRILGSFLVPAPDGVWNYNFQGVKHSPAMRYSLMLAPPLDYYSERHRPAHFLTFADAGGMGGAGGAAPAAGAIADREDAFR